MQFTSRPRGDILKHEISFMGDDHVLIRLLLAYLLLINLTAFCAMGRDKRRARRRLSRVPEKTLIGLALLGGSVGAILGMPAFRHKTKHLKFTLGLPLILLAQVAVVAAALIVLT